MWKSLEFGQHVASLSRNDSDDGSFHCKPVDGSFFTCTPQDSILTLRRGDQQWRVPLGQVLGMRGAPAPKAAPAATEPAGDTEPGKPPAKPRRAPPAARPDSIRQE